MCPRENIKCILVVCKEGKYIFQQGVEPIHSQEPTIHWRQWYKWSFHDILISLTATRQAEWRDVYKVPQTRAICTFAKRHTIKQRQARVLESLFGIWYWQDLELNCCSSPNLLVDLVQINYLCRSFLTFNMGIIISTVQGNFEERNEYKMPGIDWALNKECLS